MQGTLRHNDLAFLWLVNSLAGWLHEGVKIEANFEGCDQGDYISWGQSIVSRCLGTKVA